MPYGLIFVSVFVKGTILAFELRQPDEFILVEIEVADDFSGIFIGIGILTGCAIRHGFSSVMG